MTDANIDIVNYNIDPVFTNSADGDLAISTASSNQSILLGTKTGAPSQIEITNDTVYIEPNTTSILTGSNALALSNIRDVSSNWGFPLTTAGTINVVNSGPYGTSTQGAVDISRGYYTFSNNALVASSNIAHSNILSTDFSISSWVYYYGAPIAPGGTGYTGYLIGNMLPSSAANYWSFGVTAGQQLSMYTVANGTTSAVVYTGSNVVPIQAWTHIAATYNNTSKALQFYINGVAQSNLTTNTGFWTVANASAVSASNTGITNLGIGSGGVVLGQYSSYNNPCYIRDFRFTTGVAYAPSNPVMDVASTPIGTRLQIRSVPINTQTNNSMTVIPNGNIGIGNSNPATQLDVNGVGRFSNGLFAGGNVAFKVTTVGGMHVASGSTTVTLPPGVMVGNVLAHFGYTLDTVSNNNPVPFDYNDVNWKVTHYLVANVNSIYLAPGTTSLSKPYKITFIHT